MRSGCDHRARASLNVRVLQLALEDVLTHVEASNFFNSTCGGERRRDRQRRQLRSSGAEIDMDLEIMAHTTSADSSLALSTLMNSDITSAMSDGTFASALSTQAATHGVTSMQSVTASYSYFMTHAPTQLPTPIPSPAPTISKMPTSAPTDSPTPAPIFTPYPTAVPSVSRELTAKSNGKTVHNGFSYTEFGAAEAKAYALAMVESLDVLSDSSEVRLGD